MRKKSPKDRLKKYAIGGEVLDYSVSNQDLVNLIGQFLSFQNENNNSSNEDEFLDLGLEEEEEENIPMEEQEEIEMPESSIFGDDFLGFNQSLSDEEDYTDYFLPNSGGDDRENRSSNSSSNSGSFKVPSSGVNANIKPLFDEYSKAYGLSNKGIWGDKKHQARVSDHNTGDAIDLGTGKPNMDIANKLRSEAKQRGIKYIIHNNKIWSVERDKEGWRYYGGKGKDPHTGHIHVSFYRGNNSQNMKKKKYAGGGEVMGAVGSGISTLAPIVMGLIDELNTGYTTQPVMSARQTASLNPYSKDFGSNSLPKFANGGPVDKDKKPLNFDEASYMQSQGLPYKVNDETTTQPKNPRMESGAYLPTDKNYLNPNYVFGWESDPNSSEEVSSNPKPKGNPYTIEILQYAEDDKGRRYWDKETNGIATRVLGTKTFNSYQEMDKWRKETGHLRATKDFGNDLQYVYMGSDPEIVGKYKNTKTTDHLKPKKKRRGLKDFFAYGGEANNVPIEAEGQEIIQTPDGQMGEIQGPSHEQGGVDMSVPEGSMIYSDRIQIDGKSMADRKKAREKALNRIQKLADKNPKDKLLQSSLQRTQEVLAMEEAKDTQIQQAAGQIMQGDRKKFATGGPVEDDWQGVPYPYNPKPFDLYGGMLDAVTPAPVSMPTPTSVVSDDELGIGQPIQLNLPSDYVNPWSPIEDPNKPTYWSASGKSKKEFDESMGAFGGEYTEDQLKPMATTTNTEEEKNKNKSASGFTAGDYVGMAGNLMNAFSPLLNTLENRAGDKPNENFFKNFGKDALAANERAKTYIAGQRENALQDLRMQYNAAKAANRDRATGVNTIRAMDMATDLGAAKGKNSIYDAFSQQMMGLLGQQSQLENQQDSAVMQGEYQRDLADRQDRDNFYSQHAQDLVNMGTNIQGFGRNLNTNQGNKDMNSLISQLSKYGLGFVRDEKGNLVLSKTTQ